MRDIEKHNAQFAGVLPKPDNLLTSTLRLLTEVIEPYPDASTSPRADQRPGERGKSLREESDLLRAVSLRYTVCQWTAVALFCILLVPRWRFRACLR